MKRLIFCLAVAAAAGCREQPPPKPEEPSTPKPGIATPSAAASSSGSVIGDVLTQRPAIEAGRRAKATIEATAAKQNRELQEAMQE